MTRRTAEEIANDLRTVAPEDIGTAVLALSDEELRIFTRALLPTHDAIQIHIDDISNPTSANYDPDLTT